MDDSDLTQPVPEIPGAELTAPTDTRSREPTSVGPLSYQNWRAASAPLGEPKLTECPIYSDAHVSGELSLGPYEVLNALSQSSLRGRPGAALYVRVRRFPGVRQPELGSPFDAPKTDVSLYHGGSMQEEIAALLSLRFGVRMRAGGISRAWGFLSDDPLGRPMGIQDAELFPWEYSSGTPRVIPVRVNPVTLALDDILPRYPHLRPQDAIALVRAARMYQDALWISDPEPHLAWLLLVSAVEVAANAWREDQGNVEERMHEQRPDLVDALRAVSEAHFQEVARLMAPTLGIKRKFVDFLMEFRAPPISSRFAAAFDEERLRKAFGVIYRHRSKALHTGVPFPNPMCAAPAKLADGWMEAPPGLASLSRGGVWAASDMPMLLHTFAYLVQHALISWWSSAPTLTGTSSSPAQ